MSNKKVVLITGGARGIGFGIANHFARHGYAVALFDLDQAALDKAATELAKEHSSIAVCPVKVDVTIREQVERGVEAVKNAFGRIDVLVNNAGVVRDKRIVNMEEQDWDVVVSTNLKSQYLTCKYIAPIMIDQGFGRIINISSRAWLGGFGQSNYSAAKGGVVSLTRSLSLEFATKGITVNAIAPGIIETPMFHGFASEVQDKLRKSVPVKRIGTAQDVAHAVLFFAAPENDYITGQVLYVCGGRSLSSPSL